MKNSQFLKSLAASIILLLLLTTGLTPYIWFLWEHIRYMQFEKEAQVSNLQTSLQSEKITKEKSRQQTQYNIVNNQTMPTYQAIASNKTQYPLLAATPTFTISINAPSLVAASAILLTISGTLLINLLNAYTSLAYSGVTVNIQNPIIFAILGISLMAFFAA